MGLTYTSVNGDIMPDSFDSEDARGIIQKQTLACDEKYVLEKVFWQRTIKFTVTATSALLAFAVIIIGWNLTMAADISANTEGRKALANRLTQIETIYNKIMENQDAIIENQDEVITKTDGLKKDIGKLLKKADID